MKDFTISIVLKVQGLEYESVSSIYSILCLGFFAMDRFLSS